MSTVKLYYAEECSHCKKFKTEWEMVKRKLRDLDIKYEEYESDRDKAKVTMSGVRGFPTIRVACGGVDVEYNGNMNASSILNYVAELPYCKAGRTQRGGGPSLDRYKYVKYKTKYIKLKRERDRMRSGI